MNEEQIDDLKQFILATVSQSEQLLRGEMTDLRGEMTEGLASVRGEIKELRSDMEDSFAGVGEAIEEIHQILDTKVTKPQPS